MVAYENKRTDNQETAQNHNTVLTRMLIDVPFIIDLSNKSNLEERAEEAPR
jgi:hypothetical protein